MTDTVRFGVSLSLELLDRFDQLLRNLGYQNRSEAVRDLIREKLVQRRWGDPGSHTFAVVSLVYDHHKFSLPGRLTRMQHEAKVDVVGAMHVHVDHDNCLEIIVMRGKSKEIRTLGEKLVSLKGVKHGTISPCAPGADLA